MNPRSAAGAARETNLRLEMLEARLGGGGGGGYIPPTVDPIPHVRQGFADFDALPDPMTADIPPGSRAFTANGKQYMVFEGSGFRWWEAIGADLFSPSGVAVTPGSGWTVSGTPFFQQRGGTGFISITMVKAADGSTTSTTGAIAGQVLCTMPGAWQPYVTWEATFQGPGGTTWGGYVSSQLVINRGFPSTLLAAGFYTARLSFPTLP